MSILVQSCGRGIANGLCCLCVYICSYIYLSNCYEDVCFVDSCGIMLMNFCIPFVCCQRVPQLVNCKLVEISL